MTNVCRRGRSGIGVIARTREIEHTGGRLTAENTEKDWSRALGALRIFSSIENAPTELPQKAFPHGDIAAI